MGNPKTSHQPATSSTIPSGILLSSFSLDELISHMRGLIREEMNHHQDPTLQKDPELISRDELSKRLGMTVQTIIRLEKKGKIPVIRLGSNIRYNWPKVIEALEKTKKTTR